MFPAGGGDAPPAGCTPDTKGRTMSSDSRAASSGTRKIRGGRRRRHAPSCEPLEPRVLLATDTWTGLGATTNWSDSGNWSNGVPQANDDLVFAADPSSSASITSNDDLSGTVFNSITISGVNDERNTGDFTGGPLTLSQGITIDGAVADFQLDTTLGNGSIAFTTQGGGLTMSGAIGGSSGLTVSGQGQSASLVLDGSEPDTYTGTTTVTSASLSLDKQAGALAVPGNLVENGSPAASVVEMAANQLNNPQATVTLGPGSSFNTGSNDETIGSLVLTGGAVLSSALLTLEGGITTDASSQTSLIDGDLDFPGITPTINVAAGDPPSGAADLSIVGTIATDAGLAKAGGGTLALDSNSTYAGTTAIDAGTVELAAGDALGISNIVIASGAELEVAAGASAPTIADAISVQGSGVAGAGAIVNNSVNTTFTGAITLTGNTTIATAADPLTVSGPIGDGGNGYALAEQGSGVLVLSGSQPNTYSGTTTVDGSVELDKTPGAAAIAGNLVVGAGSMVWEGAGDQLDSRRGDGHRERRRHVRPRRPQ